MALSPSGSWFSSTSWIAGNGPCDIRSGDSEEAAMTPLIRIEFPSIYMPHNVPVSLPERMAWCPADMKSCLFRASDAVRAKGGELKLSDLFRSYDMQLGSYNDYASGRKKAFSPPPGGSLHEGGRAFDLSLDALGMPLKDFWEIADGCNLSPIIDRPDARKSES